MHETLAESVPRVTGQHRNTALAQARRTRVIQLRLAGLSYQQIADKLGYANRGTVHRIITNALQEHEAEGIDDLRHLEAARLDALQAGHWDKALNGDHTAARIVLDIMRQRARLLGLHPTDTRAPGRTGHEFLTLYDFDDKGHLVPVDEGRETPSS